MKKLKLLDVAGIRVKLGRHAALIDSGSVYVFLVKCYVFNTWLTVN